MAAEYRTAARGRPGGVVALVKSSCSAIHLAQRDVTFAVVSRAPLRQIDAFKKCMGWRFPWVRSFGTDFGADYRVSFTEDELASANSTYNFGTAGFPSEEAPDLSVFYKNGAGEVFHTFLFHVRSRFGSPDRQGQLQVPGAELGSAAS